MFFSFYYYVFHTRVQCSSRTSHKLFNYCKCVHFHYFFVKQATPMLCLTHQKIHLSRKTTMESFFLFIANVPSLLSFDCVDIYLYPCKITASLHWKSGQNRRRMDRHREPAYKGSVLQFRLQEHENAQSRLKRQCAIPLNTSYIDILKYLTG